MAGVFYLRSFPRKRESSSIEKLGPRFAGTSAVENRFNLNIMF
jgi:hypothetical protein